MRSVLKPSCFLFNFTLSDKIFNFLPNLLYLKVFFPYLIGKAILQLNPKVVSLTGHMEQHLSLILNTFLQPILPLPSLNSFKFRGELPAVGEILARVLPIVCSRFTVFLERKLSNVWEKEVEFQFPCNIQCWQQVW